VAFVNPDAATDSPTGERGECGNSGPESVLPWPWVAVGALGSVGLILGGVWLVLRFIRSA
jgi:hypothetical protein